MDGLKLNIAFDLDGTLVRLMPVVERVIFKKYGAMVKPNERFHLETVPRLTNRQFALAFDEAYWQILDIKPVAFAQAFLRKLCGLTGEPITIVTARPVSAATPTLELIRHWFDVPVFLAMVGSHKDKLTYLSNFDYFVEDRRATARLLADAGKTVIVPICPYNAGMEGEAGVEYFLTFETLAQQVERFVKRPEGEGV